MSIIITCNDRPGYGGAATNAYNLIRSLQKYDTHGIFFNCNPLYNIDPDGIGNIHHCYEYIFSPGYERKITEYRQALNLKPRLILCKNSSSVVYSRALWPHVTIMYLCPGPNGMITIEQQECYVDIDPWEEKAVSLADWIVFNSEFTKNIFAQAFPDLQTKVFDKIINTSMHHKPYPQFNDPKMYDIIVASSILTRPEKNNLFLIDILNGLPEYSKVIVGNDNDDFLDISNANVYDLVPQDQLLYLLSVSKVLVFPSIYDSSPSTVLEALHYDCNVLVSSNLDISKHLPSEFVCNDFDPNLWRDKIIHLVETDIPYEYSHNSSFAIEDMIDKMW